MAELDDELERFLASTLTHLNGVRLELPSLDDGSPPPMSAESWAAASLDPGAKPKVQRSVELPAAPRDVSPQPRQAPRPPIEPPPAPLIASPPPREALRPNPAEAAPAALKIRVEEVAPIAREDLPRTLPISPILEEEEPHTVRSVEDAKMPPAPWPPRRSEPLSEDRQRSPWHLGIIATVSLLAVGGGIWWSLRPSKNQAVLPLPYFDAITAREEGEWLVARQKELLLYSAALKPRVVNSLAKPLTSMVWADGSLYGTDGKNTLFCWDRIDAPPRSFSLDHAPVSIFVRPPNLWTLDEDGTLRQFFIAPSMTGIFLQPLDRAEVRHSGDFSLAEDGALTLLDRSTGQLFGLTREKSSYSVTARGSSYGAGARLLPSRGGSWVAKADGEKTSLVLIPPPPR